VGIGGLPGSTNFLWQAGIQFESAAFTPFWCYGTPKCSASNTYYNYSFRPGFGDEIAVTVTYADGTSSFNIQDLSEPGQPIWINSVSASPNLHSAEWIEEPMSSTAGTIITFFDLTINGAAPSMYASYVGDYNRLTVSPLSLYQSSPEFTVGG